LSSWSILELIRWTTSYLAGKGLPQPRLDAELLLADTLGTKRLDLYLQYDRPLLPAELAAFKARLLRRAQREPVQYIAGDAAFRNLRLRVDRRVLIPRPETEVLVDHVLTWSGAHGARTAVDIGTGSGAIALSLASEGQSFERIVATDVSADALEVARENLVALAPRVPVELRLGPSFAPIAGEVFDVIVSNPPYIGETELPTLDPEVREWEPAAALFSGGDGLTLIRELVTEAPGYLRPGGLLALEIGADQADEVSRLIRGTGRYGEPVVRLDFAGRDRIVMAELL
jgi:release factor glutamine methyltransferase